MQKQSNDINKDQITNRLLLLKDAIRKRINEEWKNRGHPLEVAIITNGLLIFPYFIFVIYIAPYIDPTKTRELDPKYVPLISMILIISFTGLISALRIKTNRIRLMLKIIGLILTGIPLFTPLIMFILMVII